MFGSVAAALKLPAPKPRRYGRAGFRSALRDSILPAVYNFKPDLILVSAGFDTMASDPVGGQMGLLPSDIHWATTQLVAAAEKLCNGRLVSVLEGGYDVGSQRGLARAVEAHVRAMSGHNASKSNSMKRHED